MLAGHVGLVSLSRLIYIMRSAARSSVVLHLRAREPAYDGEV